LSDPRLDSLRDNLLELAEQSPPAGREEPLSVIPAIENYDRAMKDEFGLAHDSMRLVGQDNFRRYLPVHWLRIRVHPDDSFFDLVARVAAARAAGCRITVSVPDGMDYATVTLLEERLTTTWAAAIEFVAESEEELVEVIRARQTDRIRYAAPDRVSAVVWRAVAETGLCVVTAPVLANGRIELLWYLQEQSISFDYHRYGHLGVRAGEARAEVI
jgi:RHH-type proline utilization regulon transcriptional repressor/proline dehydrogenase/delta 1-pyrroline-5-carboxylate dehydrogenase